MEDAMSAPTTAVPAVLSRAGALELVRLATLAPSGHNTQPWLFEVREDAVVVRPDFSRRLPVVDPDDHALFISLGAALENLLIAAGERGLASEVEAFGAAEPDGILVRLRPARPAEAVAEPALAAAILERQSTRRTYDRRPIPSADLRRLEQAAARDGVVLRLLTSRADVETLVPFVEDGNRAQFGDPAFVDELISWVRFGNAEAAARRDGLAGAALGMPSVPRWAGALVMKRLLSGEGEARRTAEAVRSSSALALFATESNDRKGFVDLGRSFERLALAATALGLKHAHVNMPCEVLPVRERLRAHLGLGHAQPLLLVRLGYAPARPRSLRRPVEDVLA
jgi:nitroreductase